MITVIVLHLNTISCADPTLIAVCLFIIGVMLSTVHLMIIYSLSIGIVFQTCFDTESCLATFHAILTDALDIFVPKN